MSDQFSTNNPGSPQTSASSEVTFRLAPPFDDRPLRWVTGITVGEDRWQHGYAEEGQNGEQLTVDLPPEMSAGLLRFARRHLGPNATDRQAEYACHTLAGTIGDAALKPNPSTIHMSAEAQADEMAGRIYEHGSKINPAELGVSEWAVVADPGRGDTGPSHSVVGIGRGKHREGETPSRMAIQVDTGQGELYIGDPAEYLAYEKNRALRAGIDAAQPGLYAHR